SVRRPGRALTQLLSSLRPFDTLPWPARRSLEGPPHPPRAARGACGDSPFRPDVRLPTVDIFCHHFSVDFHSVLDYTGLEMISMEYSGPIRAACGESLSNFCSMCRSTLGAVNVFSFCRSKITSHLFIPQQLKIACFQGFARLRGLTSFASAVA